MVTECGPCCRVQMLQLNGHPRRSKTLTLMGEYQTPPAGIADAGNCIIMMIMIIINIIIIGERSVGQPEEMGSISLGC